MWVETEENDVMWLSVSIDRWQFVNELQIKYKTLDSSLDIPLQMNFRDGKGDVLMSESFSLRLIDVSGRVSECSEESVEKNGDTADFMFAVDAWKYTEENTDASMQQWQYKSIEHTLDIDYGMTTSQDCFPQI
jgi:hypothetical protein